MDEGCRVTVGIKGVVTVGIKGVVTVGIKGVGLLLPCWG